MQLVVQQQNIPLTCRERSEPRLARCDGQCQVRDQPRLTGFWRRDDVHRFTLTQQSVDNGRSQFGMLIDKVGDRHGHWQGVRPA